ncbi:MAG: helix-hairpin-helix domain-containing protein [Betaproteobacteria bacterium]|nr:helix-hairpin-helix domain-containing protein [Betaproteobacteria bacterium]
MKRSIIRSALIAALLLPAGLSFAAGNSAEAPEDMKTIKSSGKTKKSSEAKKTKPAVNVKLVDINSASKAQLKKLPGIGDAEADAIIAGRPYLTKAHLVTRKIIPSGVYENLKKQIVAMQKGNPPVAPVHKPK